jgi:hypothetical protein
MAAKAKKTERSPRSGALERPGTYRGVKHRTAKGGSHRGIKIDAADFERPVIYRGIKIEPIAGKRSPIARAIRDGLRTKSEKSLGKARG